MAIRLETLWDDGERVFCRQSAPEAAHSVLIVRSAAERPLPASLDRLAHEFALKDDLDSAWAARPLSLMREGGRSQLVLEDPGGMPLAWFDAAMPEPEQFLQLAIGMAGVVSKLHQRGLVHKDIKPAHFLVHCADGGTRLTGFGLASRLPRERQLPELPETIAGSLAYMAPEQTGRMNRSIDSRSDLYALGVTFYQLLTGVLPFQAADAMEWVHCHIARQPVPPGERVGAVPAAISDIVMKLLAKTAEQRYQTAAGLEHDLRHCLTAWRRHRKIEPFPLDTYGTPDRLMIPEKLYGREREVEALGATFARVCESGLPEMVLVSGYSGIGKSSVINELHKVLVPQRGLLAAGKFDQYQRNIPYATLVQAFHGLVRALLGMSDARLATWRDALLEALDLNAVLVTDLIPELKLVIGEPPPVPELGAQQSQQRFRQVLRRFIGVFARPEHPLALVLDDLQWLDVATLDLLEDLLTHADLRHVMIVGTFRHHDMEAGHPLCATLRAIRSACVRVTELRLTPLGSTHIEQLLAESMHTTCAEMRPLARLIRDRTAGNPFFVIQFLQSLVDEALLVFDHETRQWRWDASQIHAKGYTDNVVDLMVGKLARVPEGTLHALRQLACLGHVADVTTLALMLDVSEAEVHAALWEGVRQELVERIDDSYAFAHDRIHEATYSLMPEFERTQAHLRIGRLLAVHTPRARRGEAIFEIVSQLNRGAACMTDADERESLAEFNLRAGRRARASAAHVSALTYLTTGAGLMEAADWTRRHELMFALECGRAECEFLTGQLQVAEARFAVLSTHAATTAERARVACWQVDVYLLLERHGDAIGVCLAFLRHVGIDWTERPDEALLRNEYEEIWQRIGERSIEDLIDLPPMADEVAIATLEVLASLFSPALLAHGNLAGLTICKAVNLSLAHGNGEASCVAYANFPRIAGRLFGDYAVGFRFGQLGCELVRRYGCERHAARTHLSYSLFVARWTQPMRDCTDRLRDAFETALRIGDVPRGGFACNSLVSTQLYMGESLPIIEAEARRGIEHASKAQFRLVVDFLRQQLALIRTLRGVTPRFGHFDDEDVNEAEMEARLSEGSPIRACWYWIRKLQARYLAGDHWAAMAAASHAQSLLWISHGFIEEAEYTFYAALVGVARYDVIAVEDRRRQLDLIQVLRSKLQTWATHCTENFASQTALVTAEVARIEGRVAEAELHYEHAIRLARDGGLIHIEALANELASRFYAARGLAKIARVYMQDARHGYLCWGADGKVRQLEAQHAYLRAEARAPTSTHTIAAPVEHLDLGTVIKVSQAVSGEIVPDKLVALILRTAIEQAGAERGLLILIEDDAHRMAAEATVGVDGIRLHHEEAEVNATMMPMSMLLQVLRTRESVLLDDASADPSFVADPYVRELRARSMLCLPLTNRAKLVGAIYLENNLMARVFDPCRVAVLKLVASQAAISLENARLYRDVAASEAKIRRLVESNIIGIIGWDSDGYILEANDVFLRMVGYAREELVSGRVRWRDLTPPEMLTLSERGLEEALRTGRAVPYEKEYIHKNGTRVPVIIGLATFGAESQQGVGFVLDLTERRRAEERVREGERRYREVQTELAHANRVATMGQLTASIAHEINQPIGATVTNAQAAMRWLKMAAPNRDEAMLALERIVKDGGRAADVLGRIRQLIRKGAPEKTAVAIDAAICEVIELTATEARRSGAVVTVRLGGNLPRVEGDRVALQQVLLNLIVNALEAMRGMEDGVRALDIAASAGDDGYVRVTVADTGPGFGLDEARAEGAGHAASFDTNFDTIFAAFYTTKPTGLGMGLAICRSIIDSHGGQLWASHNSPRGALMQFTLRACGDVA